jgi:vesicle-fusing ATPase
LIEGPLGSGKTSIAAHLAKQSDFPFVKLISPETLVGYSETSKAAKITKIFDDAHKSQLSFIILDDLERLIDYVRIGPRFSNVVLQTLIVLIKKPPPKGRRLLVVATTSNKRVIEDTELLSSFDVVLEAPQIESQEELKTVLSHLNFASGESLLKAVKNFTPPISIKRLIMLTEMAKQGGQEGIIERFRDALNM